MNVKPVSQQYVKRGESFALLDLYFPQLHIGIEVDEAFHKSNQTQDGLRMDDILAAVEEDELEDFLVLRIDATLPVDDLHRRIDEVVAEINRRATKVHAEWFTYEEELEQCRSQEFLSVHDAYTFKDIKDIANTVFGKNSKRYQRSYFSIGEQTWLWCPKLSIVEEGSWKSAAAGWINRLAEDWSYIDESHEDAAIVAERKETYGSGGKADQQRVVFAKYKDHLGFHRYRFVGVFQLRGISPLDDRFLRYERIRKEVAIVRS